MNPFAIRKEIIRTGKILYDKDLICAGEGNISVRLGADRILITSSGGCKGFLTNDDLLEINLKGELLSSSKGKKASSEMWMHLEFYRKRPDVQAVVHAHPVYATSFAVAGIPLTRCLLPEVVVTLGAAPLVEYGTPSTDELPRSFEKYIHKASAFLMKNHGAVTVGKNLTESLFHMETLEHFARIQYFSTMLGGPQPLNREQVEKLQGVRKKMGFTNPVYPCDIEDGDCKR